MLSLIVRRIDIARRAHLGINIGLGDRIANERHGAVQLLRVSSGIPDGDDSSTTSLTDILPKWKDYGYKGYKGVYHKRRVKRIKEFEKLAERHGDPLANLTAELLSKYWQWLEKESHRKFHVRLHNMFRNAERVEEEEFAQRQIDSLEHEMKRQELVDEGGIEKLSYRQMQRLCTLNQLKATGKKQCVKLRLVRFFRRLDPQRLQKMRFQGLMNMRSCLDDDPDQEEATEFLNLESVRFPSDSDLEELFDKEEVERLKTDPDVEEQHEKLEGEILYRLKLSFVADLGIVEKEHKLEDASRRLTEVMGVYFAAPAARKAKCRTCGEMIKKDTVRVCQHLRFKRYNSSGGWTYQQSKVFHHAGCFVNSNNSGGSNIAKDDKVGDLTVEQMDALKSALVESNRWATKQKEWKAV